jgi:hypothetical protein
MERDIVKRDRPPICIWLGIILVLYLFISIAAIICVHLDILKVLGGAKLLKAHVMCGGFGMLGAGVASIRKYYRTLITETATLATAEAVKL